MKLASRIMVLALVLVATVRVARVYGAEGNTGMEIFSIVYVGGMGLITTLVAVRGRDRLPRRPRS